MPGITNQNTAPQLNQNQKLSYTQLAALAYQAGFRGVGLANIVAISEAESGGNTNAGYIGYTQGTHNSIGVAQINANAHPQYSATELLNPLANFEAAYQISNGGVNFSPWTTYQTGAYSQYLNPANQAATAIMNSPSEISKIISGLPGNLGFGVLGGLGASALQTTNPVNSVESQVANAIINLVPWLKILEILGGIILVVFGIFLLTRGIDTETIKEMAVA